MNDKAKMTAADRFARSTWTIVGICVAVIAAFVVVSFVYLKTISDRSAEDRAKDQIIACFTKWSNASTARTDLLTGLSRQRSDADRVLLDALSSFVLEVTRHPAQAKRRGPELIRASAAYKKADAAYKKALKEHPVPASPEFSCSGGKKGVGPASQRGGTTPPPSGTTTGSTTVSGPPGRRMTATATSTATRTVTTPGATTTRTATLTAPPRTRTVTTTRTVSAPLPAVVCDHLPTPLRRELC